MNYLSLALLEKEVKDNPRIKRISERNLRISEPASLVYKGPPDQGPDEMQRIRDLLRKIIRRRIASEGDKV